MRARLVLKAPLGAFDSSSLLLCVCVLYTYVLVCVCKLIFVASAIDLLVQWPPVLSSSRGLSCLEGRGSAA